MTEASEAKMLEELKAISARLSKIETYLWPPIDPPNRPKGPNDDPPVLGPGDLYKQVQALAAEMANMNGRTAEELEELRLEITRTSFQVAALNESYEALARVMQLPG